MPLAVDTNILARALTDDGTEHSRKAITCFRENTVFVSDTVMLETEWLMRSRLKITRNEIQGLFHALLSWPSVEFSDRHRIANAVVAHGAGVDFADALHVMMAENCDAMLTYDDDFVRRSTKIPDGIPVRFP